MDCRGPGTCTRPSAHLPPLIPPETRPAISLWPTEAKQISSLNFFLSFFPQFLLSVPTFFSTPSYSKDTYNILFSPPPTSPLNHWPPSDHHPHSHLHHHPQMNHQATAQDLLQPLPHPYQPLECGEGPVLVHDC